MSDPLPRIFTLRVLTQDVILHETRSTRDEMISERGKRLGEKAYLVSSIVVPHLREVLFENFLVEGSFAHICDR